MKKVIITVDTNWCGMKQEYASILPDNYETNKEVQHFLQSLAYDNFESYGCSEYVLEEMFDYDYDLEEETGDGYTDEQYLEAGRAEHEYYEWSVEEINEDNEDELEEWKTYPYEKYAGK